MSSNKSAGYDRGDRVRKPVPKPTGKAPKFRRSKSRGDKQKTLEAFLVSQVKAQWVRHSNTSNDFQHPMFGPLTDKLCRAPYKEAHSAKTSWRKICRILAERAGVLSLD
jgi:hypothetical protein